MTTQSTESIDGKLNNSGNTLAAAPMEYSRNEEIKISREYTLLKTSAESIQNYNEQEVLALQSSLQHGQKYGFWQTPIKWSASETSSTVLNIDLRRRIVHFLPKAHQELVEGADRLTSTHLSNATNIDLVHKTTAVDVRRILDCALLTLTRYLVLLRMGPVGIGRRGMCSSLDPSNVKQLGYRYLPGLFAVGVSKCIDSCSFDSGCLSTVQAEDLSVLSVSMQKGVFREIQRMQNLKARGYWCDAPVNSDSIRTVSEVMGAAPKDPSQELKNPHLPLPDDYVSEMGRCSLWLIEELAPNLLTIGDEILSIWTRTYNPSISAILVGERRKTILDKFLRNYVWRDSKGGVIRKPPFSLRLTRFGTKYSAPRKRAKVFESHVAAHGYIDDMYSSSKNIYPESSISTTDIEWPPCTFVEIMGLINNVQSAHLFVVTLSTGGRRSEILDLKRSCVQYAPNGTSYARGRTFKLTQKHDGEFRDWILPDLAVEAIQQQLRLVTLVETIGPVRPERLSTETISVVKEASHLWAQLSGASPSNRRAPLLGLGQSFVSYAKSLGMDTAPGGQNIRPHRFRKTVARLVALALTQAPKILMDVFGHKSIEMTLYYILSDKDLQVEIEQVSRELRVMRAKEVIEKMVDEEDLLGESLSLGGYGGPAALIVKKAIDVQKVRHHRCGEEWGATSALELAEILTLQGRAWQLVRSGVICTKFPGTEFGPCNKSTGHPEPSRCEAHCKHRLEESYLREDVDGAIRDAVKAYRESNESGDGLVGALWAGQIRTHIARFEDLRIKWMNNPTVRHALDLAATEGKDGNG